MFAKAATVDDLLHRVYNALLRRGRVIRPTRGPARELTGVVLCLTNPRARLSRSAARGRLFSALGELLWYLAKTNELAFIEYYISAYRKDSDDGKTIHGAYGPRLFSMRGIDQVANATRLLAARGESRRVVIQLFCAEDIIARRKEVPCTCTLQFLRRQGQLDMITHMRSNDAFLGLPHDVFAFTMLQELVARTIGVEPGNYYHMVGSLHLYDENRPAARRYLKEGWQSTTHAMPPMPSGSPWGHIRSVLASEQRIRLGVRKTHASLPPYWMDLVRLLEIYRFSKEELGALAGIERLERAMSSAAFTPYIRDAAATTAARTSERHPRH